jgi:hypothetical protein
VHISAGIDQALAEFECSWCFTDDEDVRAREAGHKWVPRCAKRSRFRRSGLRLPAVPSDSHLERHSLVTDYEAAVLREPRTGEAIAAMRILRRQFRGCASHRGGNGSKTTPLASTAFVGDLQNGTARLAVHRVGVVPHQRAGRTAEADLVRLQKHPDQH